MIKCKKKPPLSLYSMKGGFIMKKYKKLVAICLTLVICTFLFPVEVGAIAGADRIIKPMYVDIDVYSNSFDINSNGLACVFTSVYAATADNTSVSVYLEKFNNGSWSYVNSWYGSGVGAYSYAGGDYYVAHGQYRIRSYCYVYIDGRMTDSDSYISYVVTY